MGVSPTRPACLLQSPPVEPADARLPYISRTTQPTVEYFSSLAHLRSTPASAEVVVTGEAAAAAASRASMLGGAVVARGSSSAAGSLVTPRGRLSQKHTGICFESRCWWLRQEISEEVHRTLSRRGCKCEQYRSDPCMLEATRKEKERCT